MKQRNLLIGLAILSFIFFAAGNSLLPITDPVESNYALTAKEMVWAGDWISPRIYGIFWYDKPIMVYWLLCLSYSVLGVTDFAARLPGAVFGMASVVLTAWYVLRQSQKRHIALLSAAMVGTSLEVWAISHAIVTDQILFFFTAATMFFAYIGITEDKRSYVTAAYAMSALAVLTKGPVGLVLPGLFLLVFAGLRRNAAYFKRIFPISGILAFCLIALPWYGSMYYLHGQDFIDGLLGLNNIVRATSSEHPEMNVWYYYVVLVPVSLLPWTGPCLYALWKRRQWSDSYVFLAVWSLGTILFYTCMATKYPTYSYIANMPLILMGSRGIMDIYYKNKRHLWAIVTAPAIFYWLLLFGATFALKWGNWIPLYVFIPLAVIIVMAAQWKRSYPAIPVLIALGTVVIYGIILPQGIAQYFQYRSSKDSIPLAQKVTGPVYFFEDFRTSFVYYTGVSAAYISIPPEIAKQIKPDRSAAWSGKYLYTIISPEQVLQQLDRKDTISIIVPKNDHDHFLNSPFFAKTQYVDQIGMNYLYVTKK